MDIVARVEGSQAIQPRAGVETVLVTCDGQMQALLLDPSTGTHYRLNSSATAVWALLDRPCTVKQLAAELVETFGLDPDLALSLTDTALESFANIEIVEHAGVGPSPTGSDVALSDRRTHRDGTGAQRAGSNGVTLLPREPDP